MPSVRLSQHPEVAEDIVRLLEFIAWDDLDAARRVHRAIRQAIRGLQDDPERGALWGDRTRHRKLKDVRLVLALPFRQFPIFYRFTGDEIRVLYVVRAAQNLDAVHHGMRRN